jgi:hypothetical protein
MSNFIYFLIFICINYLIFNTFFNFFDNINLILNYNFNIISNNLDFFLISNYSIYKKTIILLFNEINNNSIIDWILIGIHFKLTNNLIYSYESFYISNIIIYI